MRPFIQLTDRMVKKWNGHLEAVSGLKLEPHILIGAATSLVLLVQMALFYIISSKDVYCKLPSMRDFYMTRSTQQQEYNKLPRIYVITPTYARYVQKAELTRLSQTLMLVPNVHWILVEDSDRESDVVSKLSRRLRNEFDFQAITLLHEQTPAKFKLKPGEPRWKYPKGVWQRNRALRWLRDNLMYLDQDGVVYFADDDNTYDLALFDEMRQTKRVSVWPVGFVGGLLVERPIVSNDDLQRVSGFNSMWERRRPYPIDMAGFAISLRLLMSRSEVSFSDRERIGYIESHFLGQLIKSLDELEPMADRCTKVLVWHTQTKNPALHEERKLTRPSHEEMEL